MRLSKVGVGWVGRIKWTSRVDAGSGARNDQEDRTPSGVVCCQLQDWFVIMTKSRDESSWVRFLFCDDRGLV